MGIPQPDRYYLTSLDYGNGDSVDYSYDKYGNVTKESYGDSGWSDLLTAHDGNNYSYDTIGNLTSDGSKSYTWKNGRELETITLSNGTVWTNTYDANGMRIRRASSATVYDYVYNGSQLSQMWITHVSSEKIDKFSFTYDANGIPMTVTYNGTTYYYVTNIQGDVVAILNGSGQEVVNYTYDAWGYLWFFDGSMTFTLGLMNPLRYRGYVFDHETGLYYLESRYYNPKIGRFLTADIFAATGQGFVGNNMFAYCLNNPVNLVDESGTVARPARHAENGPATKRMTSKSNDDIIDNRTSGFELINTVKRTHIKETTWLIDFTDFIGKIGYSVTKSS